jgi:hypothetical protein
MHLEIPLHDCADSGETVLAKSLEPRNFGQQSSREDARKRGVGPPRPRSDNREFVRKSPSFISYGDFLIGELDKGERF